MLQEWLEELAEDEMKKTASSQFEEVLHEMDIPELKAFFEMNQGLEKSAQDPAVPDPAAGSELPFGFERVPEQTMRRHAFGGGLSPLDPNLAEAVARREMRGAALSGGVTGAAVGGIGGAGYGASLGGVRGALLGGLGGAALGGAAGYGVPRALEPWVAQGARKGAIEDRDLLEQIQAGTKKAPLLSRLEEKLEGTPESMKYAAAQDPEGTYNKIKQAADAGRALAQLGFVPKVIEPSFGKEAQVPGGESSLAPQALRTVQADPVNRDQFIQESERGGQRAGGIAGGLLGGAGAGLGGAALGQRFGGGRGALIGGLAGGALGAAGGAAGWGALSGRSASGLSDEQMQASQNFNLANDLYQQGKISGEEFELAERQLLGQAPSPEGSLVPQTQQIPKQASFRDTILKVASDGNLPQNHGWEL